jgi:hypothetical protein
MTAEHHDIGTELGPAERELADRLSRQRPVPAGAFRGALDRHLAERNPGYGPRPERLRLLISAYLGGGSLLLVLGALSCVGAL